MTSERTFMEQAIRAAHHCQPANPALIPRVGAVIVKDGVVLATGHRGPDDHAEFDAFGKVQDKTQLVAATIFTTLEPCTGAVRRDPSIACTDLIIQYGIRRVFVGMLDPNQGVCGKGIIALQDHRIDVSLFDPDLVHEVTVLNAEFVRAQRALGIEIIDPQDGAKLPTYKSKGVHTFRCRTRNPPGPETRVVVSRDGRWWPQAGHLTRISSTDEYEFSVHFGSYGQHDVHVVKVSDLGALLFDYYKSVAAQNINRRERITGNYPDVEPGIFWGDYAGIPMTTPPRGLDIQATVSVEIEEPPQKS